MLLKTKKTVNETVDATVLNLPVSVFKTMVLSAPMKQGASTFAFTWNYSFTVDNNGIFKFTRTGQNANAALVEMAMRALLDYIENDKFSLDFFVNGATVLGQFNSKDNPLFSFTGNLK